MTWREISPDGIIQNVKLASSKGRKYFETNLGVGGMLLELQKGGENGEEEDHSWGDQQYLGKVAENI